MLTKLLRRLVAKRKDPFLFKKYEGNLDFFHLPAEIGLYVHIPFCRSICPFCPYNKMLYSPELAAQYTDALLMEISLLAPWLQGKAIPSIYFGGGTPTLLLDGIGQVLSWTRQELGFTGEIGIELHPREATPEVLSKLKALGIELISLGIQTFSDSTLKKLGRNHSAQEAGAALKAVTAMGFDCVDVDIMFNLPDQTAAEIEEDISLACQAGVDQLSIYPLILFPFTALPEKLTRDGYQRFSSFQEWRLLKRIEEIATRAGYQRTSIWTYGRPGGQKYTSITRENYLGLGAGAASQYGDSFYLNTFDVTAYIDRVQQGILPINLVNSMSQRESMAYWLFWRCYETIIDGQNFSLTFGTEINEEFSWELRLARLIGLLKREGKVLRLPPLGLYLYHLLEKHYSLTYLNDTWAACQKTAWLDQFSLD